MSHHSSAPTQPEECLTQSRASRYKGGTIIVEEVWSVGEHRRRVADPDGYRPQECRHCGGMSLHVHDYVERHPCGLLGVAVVMVVRYLCVGCGATWRMLPAFLARHLWWVWRSAEQAVDDSSDQKHACVSAAGQDAPRACSGGETSGPECRQARMSVPARTVRRWRSRLASSARQIVTLFATRGTEAVKAVAKTVGLDSSRDMLVRAYGQAFAVAPGARLGAVAALTDRLERGIRLM